MNHTSAPEPRPARRTRKTSVALALAAATVHGLSSCALINETTATATASPTVDVLTRPATAEGPYPVQYVSDGDTIGVNINGKTTTVRMIGIDTPEVKDPRKPVQCFGTEASGRAYELLNNTQVWLEYDPAVERQDRYGRTLAYVWADQTTLANQVMLTGGFAHEYTYNNTAYKYQAAFKAEESAARTDGKGLWAADTCNGDTNIPAD